MAPALPQQTENCAADSEAPRGCAAPLSHEAFWVSTCTGPGCRRQPLWSSGLERDPLGIVPSPRCPRQGDLLCGQEDPETSGRGNPFTVKSCPPAASFPSTVGNAGGLGVSLVHAPMQSFPSPCGSGSHSESTRGIKDTTDASVPDVPGNQVSLLPKKSLAWRFLEAGMPGFAGDNHAHVL